MIQGSKLPPVTPEFIRALRKAFPGVNVNGHKVAEITKDEMLWAEAQKQVVDWAERWMVHRAGGEQTSSITPLEPNTTPVSEPKPLPLWKRVFNKLAFWRK
jgi:hypothetical protein